MGASGAHHRGDRKEELGYRYYCLVFISFGVSLHQKPSQFGIHHLSTFRYTTQRYPVFENDSTGFVDHLKIRCLAKSCAGSKEAADTGSYDIRLSPRKLEKTQRYLQTDKPANLSKLPLYFSGLGKRPKKISSDISLSRQTDCCRKRGIRSGVPPKSNCPEGREHSDI